MGPNFNCIDLLLIFEQLEAFLQIGPITFTPLLETIILENDR